jgi:aryl-alcohol dehydrogenase-like predicted oxidoreductase
MQTRQLGMAGPPVTVIGFGAFPIAGQMGNVAKDAAIVALQRSIELGSTLIDTAESYGPGRSEEMIGEAIKDRRDQVFLATKVSGGERHLAYQSILRACDASLRRLQTDYIDLYQCHWVDPQTPVEESMQAMDDLVRAGKVRYVGVSNFDVALLRRCLSVRHVDSIQPVYHLFERDIEAALIPFCREHGIGILAYSPLAKGLLTGKYTIDTVFPPDDERSQMPSFRGEQWRTSLERVERLKELGDHGGARRRQERRSGGGEPRCRCNLTLAGTIARHRSDRWGLPRAALWCMIFLEVDVEESCDDLVWSKNADQAAVWPS